MSSVSEVSYRPVSSCLGSFLPRSVYRHLIWVGGLLALCFLLVGPAWGRGTEGTWCHPRGNLWLCSWTGKPVAHVHIWEVKFCMLSLLKCLILSFWLHHDTWQPWTLRYLWHLEWIWEIWGRPQCCRPTLRTRPHSKVSCLEQCARFELISLRWRWSKSHGHSRVGAFFCGTYLWHGAIQNWLLSVEEI